MINISIGGAEGFNRALGILEDEVKDIDKIIMDVVPPLLYEHMNLQFNTNGAHGGKPWAAYSSEPRYGAWKRRVAGHSKRLQMREPFQRLRPSLIRRNHPENILRFQNKTLEFGTKVPYAKDLNEGGTGPFGEPYPPRKIFSFKREQINDIIREIQREINRSLKATQGRGIGTVRRNL